MHIDSLWYRFHPDSPGWLRRRHERGDAVSPEDVARVLEHNPGATIDPVINDYAVRAARGVLKMKAGRKRSAQVELRLMYAECLLADLVPRLIARRERQKARGIRKIKADFPPTELAEELVARRIRYADACSLRNALSARKSVRMTCGQVSDGCDYWQLPEARRLYERTYLPPGTA